jgi:hypothetical protein
LSWDNLRAAGHPARPVFIFSSQIQANSPDHLLKGPGGQAILPAAYEGYSQGSWS